MSLIVSRFDASYTSNVYRSYNWSDTNSKKDSVRVVPSWNSIRYSKIFPAEELRSYHSSRCSFRSCTHEKLFL